MPDTARIVPLARQSPSTLSISVDGDRWSVPRGSSVLAAILSVRRTVRTLMVSGEARAGFCLMGACQECWIWRGDGTRLRACTSEVEDGMELYTAAPPGFPADV